jgi:myosin heavy subunit
MYNILIVILNLHRSRHSGRGGNVALKTLGGQFKQQLNDLIVTLNATYPHFVRCMKPNDNKIPDQFNSLRMQDQLRYAGLLEVCRIRKLGYPIRRPFQEFYRRFRCCDVSCSSLDELLKFLTSKGVLVHGEWAKGKTRVFMRNEQAAILEDFRESALVKYVVKMQNIGRGMVARVRRRKCLKLIEDLGSAIKVREEGGLVYYLELCHLFPHEGIHLEVVKSARSLLARVTQENRVTSELKSAISSKTLQALRKSAASATAMEPPFLSPLVDEAVALAQKIEIETEATRLLSEAISSRDRRLLSAAIAYCDNSNYSCDDLENARKLLVQVEIECSALSMLEDAVSRRHVEDIDVALQRCYDAHLSALQPVALARELKDRIIQERKDASVDEMTKRLQKAIADGDLQGLKEAVAFVTSAESDLKVTSDKALLSQARNLMLELDVAATKLALSAATKNQDADALSAAISNAERLEMNCDEVDLAVKTKQLLDKSRIKDRLKARIMGKKGKADGGDHLT